MRYHLASIEQLILICDESSQSSYQDTTVILICDGSGYQETVAAGAWTEVVVPKYPS